ncbi:hypothetical protein A3D84_00255 [Candidatus Woesebacteria bacterium RIFCSPHIGHO2_02_FULL_42_20]|uniref:Peptidase M20 dimerisation domain-containing protein n=1 Tax=Candidatus Woesebacteria bacterium RIFCSPHIGHO2_12_FULL_41_24 TaxID=1802510 RepID=A0A1F8AV52_9BACT|nr:MAG: hypothetical protein A2W15_01755 [Candidatus Woesebacteria bacterium RBG_16_41_13]OGM29683.1 MAG: hypothetical protein A2873_02175 [Candidatus Woesebacteria bacterium RIFCSPHIGHO2_01_FULL_42_80]OGM35211.1 MAG: hypothetical protein A3D84_00255 [Candidatus Woesebacteria bacterium RIFCSPHIGHO2_02_FULL_42_20]OGM55105.1 MAG: hypothetical protein A3E44_04260 [Candidatus Woesebacteria bacterium RIFCSPHIGHO2_12_FULL_41_24]OGM67677.1 MAG: hypothetical protein A2969_01965 [Candidatus Woesebacteri
MLSSRASKTIQKKIDLYEDDLVNFCKELVRIPSVNGLDKEKHVAALVFKKAQRLRLPVQIVALDKERPNVFIGTNYSQKRGLLFAAHLDTAPVGDRRLWKHKPFAAEVEDGKLFGRGAIDCKGGIALSIYALKIISDLGYNDIAKFVASSDEEVGADSPLGSKFLLEKGLNAEAAIYTYPGLDAIKIGHRGLVKMSIEVLGEAAHVGSKSWQLGKKGKSAITATVDFLQSLDKFHFETEYHKDFPGYCFIQTPIYIKGGSAVGIVPDSVKLIIDARFLPNQDRDVYIKWIKKLAKKKSKDKILIKPKLIRSVQGSVISRNEKIVKILQSLSKNVLKTQPVIEGSGPINEAYLFNKVGIPTVCGFGVEGEGAHSSDEYLKIDSLVKILEVYVKAAIELGS